MTLLCPGKRDGYLCVSAPMHSHLHPLHVSAALFGQLFCVANYFILERHFGVAFWQMCVSQFIAQAAFSVWWLNNHTNICLRVFACSSFQLCKLS